MAYNRNNNQRDNKNSAPRKNNKPVTKILPLITSGVDSYGNPYNPDSLYDLLCDLEDSKVFTKLSVSLTIEKVYLGDNNGRGVKTIARVQSYDKANGQMSICLFGQNTEYANILNGMVIVPKVRINRNSEEVSTILGFDIVPATKA